MQKRSFLSGAVTASLAGLTRTSQAQSHDDEPVLLTVSGAVGRPNRGPMDHALDQMMSKHGIEFSQATTLGASALARLSAVSIRPVLEYDKQPHTLSGPLLTTVLQAVGVSLTPQRVIELRALDGYNTTLSVAEIRARRMLVATHIDGRRMGLGGLGPQWAVYDPAQVPALKGKSLTEGFQKCPWGLYHVGVH
jgi:hypothetical protein